MAARQSFPEPRSIRVDKDGPIPTIEVRVGQAQLGTYDLIIWPLRGNPRRIGRGDTLDEVPDVHRMVRTREQLQQIDRFRVTAVIAIQAVERRAGARWSYDLIVRQGETELAHATDAGEVDRPLRTIRIAYKIDLA